MKTKNLTAFSLVLFLCLITSASYSQEVIYFSKDTSAVKSKKLTKRSTEKNVVKIAPLSFLSGNLPVYFERELTDFLSVQLGAGVTTRNYLKEWANNLELGEGKGFDGDIKWNDVPDFTGDNNNSLTDFTNRKSALGFTFSVEPRIYFESEGIGGAFISFGYSYSKYKSSSRKIQTGPAINGEAKFTNSYFGEHENVSDISVNFGSQVLNDRISIEYLVGIALRNKSGSTYVYGYDYSYDYSGSGSYVDGVGTFKKTVPALLFSFKIGYHW